MTDTTEKPATSAVITELGKLRAEWLEDIEVLETMGEEVHKIRRRFRTGLQQLDILEKMVLEENAGLRRSNEDLATALEAERARATTLDHEVSRLQTLLLERPAPRRETA